MDVHEVRSLTANHRSVDDTSDSSDLDADDKPFPAPQRVPIDRLEGGFRVHNQKISPACNLQKCRETVEFVGGGVSGVTPAYWHIL